jgi:hypothetical protein
LFLEHNLTQFKKNIQYKNMKEVFKKIAYLLTIFMIAVSCSSPRYASAQNDGYDDGDNYGYNNNDDNNNYTYDEQGQYQGDYDDPNNYEEEPADVNINVFTDALSPYGNWMDYPAYGRVWIPHYTGFVPYSTGGHWAYSPYGWTWASDYSWGWAPFHYGRWAYDPFYGWMWVPGSEWGPAWVSWRSGGGYYGWSPLSPGVSIGINVGFGAPANHWIFAPSRYMGYRNINRYYVAPSHNTQIIHNTTIINNTTVYNNRKFVAGPNRFEVEKYTGKKINTVRIVNASQPINKINGNTIQMYRPGVKAKVQQKLQNYRQQNNTGFNQQNINGQKQNHKNLGQQNNNGQKQNQVITNNNYNQNNQNNIRDNGSGGKNKNQNNVKPQSFNYGNNSQQTNPDNKYITPEISKKDKINHQQQQPVNAPDPINNNKQNIKQFRQNNNDQFSMPEKNQQSINRFNNKQQNFNQQPHKEFNRQQSLNTQQQPRQFIMRQNDNNKNNKRR